MRMRRVIWTVFKLGVAAVVVVLLAGFTFETIMRATASHTYPPHGRLVDVGGYKLHIRCEGQGRPTVVLEAGQDVQGSLTWARVQDGIAAVTRVCAYDRAGILWSGRASTPRTSQHIAEDLQRLPAVLQAIVRFANRVGVFRFVSLWPRANLPDSLNAVINRFRPYSMEEVWAEFLLRKQSAGSARHMAPFGDLPLKVLTAGAKPAGMSESRFEVYQKAWWSLQHDLSALSTVGTDTVIPDASHYIQLDRPDVVIAAVRDVVREARQRAARSALKEKGDT